MNGHGAFSHDAIPRCLVVRRHLWIDALVVIINQDEQMRDRVRSVEKRNPQCLYMTNVRSNSTHGRRYRRTRLYAMQDGSRSILGDNPCVCAQIEAQPSCGICLVHGLDSGIVMLPIVSQSRTHSATTAEASFHLSCSLVLCGELISESWVPELMQEKIVTFWKEDQNPVNALEEQELELR